MNRHKKLIAQVRQHPELYDHAHQLRRNTAHRSQLWREIAEKLHISAEDAKNKWRHLRDGYAKYLRSCCKLESEQGSRHKVFGSAHLMGFMRAHSTGACRFRHQGDCLQADADHRATDTHDSDDEPVHSDVNLKATELPEEEKMATNQNGDNHATKDDSKKRPARKVPHKLRRRPDKTRARLGVTPPVEASNAISDSSLTAIEQIFLAYAKTAHGFSPRRQALVKMKVAEVMAEAELAQIEEERQQQHEGQLECFINVGKTEYMSEEDPL